MGSSDHKRSEFYSKAKLRFYEDSRHVIAASSSILRSRPARVEIGEKSDR